MPGDSGGNFNPLTRIHRRVLATGYYGRVASGLTVSAILAATAVAWALVSPPESGARLVFNAAVAALSTPSPTWLVLLAAAALAFVRRPGRDVAHKTTSALQDVGGLNIEVLANRDHALTGARTFGIELSLEYPSWGRGSGLTHCNSG